MAEGGQQGICYTNKINSRKPLTYCQIIVFDKIRLGYGKNRQAIFIDDLAIFDYALSTSEITSLNNKSSITPLFPKNGDRAHSSGVNLSWKSSIKDEFVVALATDADFTDQRLIRTSSQSLLVKELQNGKSYFWKVGVIKDGQPSFPWKSFSTFKAEDGLQKVKFEFTQKRMRAATVGDNSYSEKLSKRVRATPLTPSKKKVELFYAKVSGPEWLRCHQDGSLTTNHGATQKGKHKFVFSVSSRYGQPVEFEVDIVVN